ncbi:GspH/FimT family pseudopilin [Pseudomonas putida]|uniref:GspH/FimT family pseudopilin n=1 Tax=Pseudomonas putida TaxID=303 RepID=UPI0018AB03FA|nr:GspH/FimT family pseudopilin [Pseudomonas putida]MBF8652450.1 GspH/FimT family pseudopilin [Pseudomonas putida]MBF8656615.1 GspH/FimT family pseudopilin [Pseudomonas putida]
MKQQGVTLIQTVSALAVLAVLTQLGAPAYVKLSDDLHRAAVTRDLAQTLRSARGHAMLLSEDVRVQALDDAWGNGWRVMLVQDSRVLREQRLRRPLQIAANLGPTMTFTAMGLPVNPAGNWLAATFEVCTRSAGTSQHQVVMASSGRVRVSNEIRDSRRCTDAGA